MSGSEAGAAPASDEPVRPAASHRRVRQRHHVGRLDDFAPDAFRIVQAGREQLGVVRTRDGLRALRNYCPHMGAKLCRGDVRGTMRADGPDQLRYDEDQLVVRCPWHRWEWALDSGEPVGRVTSLRAKTFEIQVEDGDVYVLV